MTRREELWKIYTDRNPQFLGDGEVTMSAAGLRKLFDQTYDNAFDAGKAAAEALRKMQPEQKNPFGSLFGGR